MFTRSLIRSSMTSSSSLSLLSLRSFSSSSATSSKATIGFIGLGNMGGHMAFNLFKNGYNMRVFDVSNAAIDQWLSRAASSEFSKNAKASAASHEQLVSECDIIVTMLPSSPHVDSFYVSGSPSISSVWKSLSPSRRRLNFAIDSSTIDPGVSRSVASSIHSLPIEMVDAPVSGGVGGAQAGTLTFMVGGSDASFAKAQPILSCMGKNIVHCGASGNGQVAKVANNLVLGISMIAVSEGMNLGVKLGMDPKKLANIFNTSSARCWSSDTYNPCPGVMENVPSARGYSGGFGTTLMKKDMGLALDAAKAAGVPLPLVSAASNVYQQVIDQGNGGKDFSYVYQLLHDQSKKN